MQSLYVDCWRKSIAVIAVAFTLYPSIVLAQFGLDDLKLPTKKPEVTKAPVTAAPLSRDELLAVKQAEAARIAAIQGIYGSVVAIYGNDRGGGGSGVLYDAHGFAITNHHVVAAAGVEGWAGLADGKLYRWRLLGSDPGGDVAIIQLLGRNDFPVAPLGNSDQVRVGQWAMAMGNPFVLAEDQRPTVTLGIVSGVKRFQPGEGMNQLVYGNCIQVDSSINPGNSGGPLFNLLGQVIGINGRGSFEERGRVNVGLGYAISSNQVKLFLPDLLATKIAQHGTLDAIFGNREQGVVCFTMNLDSPIARKGLALGDRIISLEGERINDANQLTNLLSTYPAGWPVTVVFDHEGTEKKATVRLTPLPYEPIVKTPSPMPQPKDEEKPATGEGEKTSSSRLTRALLDEPSSEPKPAEEPAPKSDDKPSEEKKPEEPKAPSDPKPKIVEVPRQPPIPLSNAGKPRAPQIGSEVAKLLLQRLRDAATSSTTSEPWEAIRLESEILENGEVVGRETMLIARDGRSMVTYTRGLVSVTIAFDGKVYRMQSGAEAPREVSLSRAFRDSHFASSMALATLVNTSNDPRFEKVAHEGSDKAAATLAHRLSIAADDSESLYFYLKVLADNGTPTSGLLKTSVGTSDEEPIPSMLYRDEKAIASVRLPHERVLVRGLDEQVLATIRTTSAETVAKVEEGSFDVTP